MRVTVAEDSGRAAALVFAAAFCIYTWTASPVMGWLDSPELAAAAASLGVAHSPGHPVPALFGKLGTLLPFGDLAFRVNLMSAVAAAAAAMALFWAGRIALERVAPGSGSNTVAAAAASLVFAYSWAAWVQGTHAEVYALQAALLAGTLAALLCFDERNEPRFLYLAGLLCGLALANHHLIAILLLAPAAIFVFARRAGRPGLRTAGITAAFGILGLAALLYLPVRSAQHPEVSWGAPHTAERFAWTVSASAFQKSVTEERVSSRPQDLAQVLRALVENLGAPVVVLALLGLYLGMRRRGWRAIALLLAGIVAFAVAGRVLVGFAPEVPDHHGYLLPALAALMLLALAGAVGIASEVPNGSARARRFAQLVAPLVLAGLVLVQLSKSASIMARSRAYASDQIARWELERLPPRSLLAVSYFQTSFRIWALRTLEHARPDVAILDRSFMTYPGMAGEARRRHPELAPLIDAPLRAGSPTPVAILTELAARRPVWIQLHPNLDAAADRWLAPAGAFARMSTVPLSEKERDRLEAIDRAERARLGRKLEEASPADRRGVRATLVWHDFLRLRFYCAVGRRLAAREALASAAALAPSDALLSQLAERCRLPLPGDRDPGG